MEKFRTKTMRVKISCTCINQEYFDSHFREYYNFLSCEISPSKRHGYYNKRFYKIKSLQVLNSSGLDMDRYFDLPIFVCASEIY